MISLLWVYVVKPALLTSVLHVIRSYILKVKCNLT